MNISLASILVIEDDPLSLYSMVDFLEAENFKVTGVRDGDIALKIIQQKSFDLIVCDLLLPNRNGYEVFSSLKKNINTADIPFIVVTGKNKRQDIRLGMEIGVSDYITKPFLNEELIKAINAQLEKKRFLEKCYQTKSQNKRFLEKCYKANSQASSKIVIQKHSSKYSLYYDNLTNLPNQLSLRDIFESEKVVNQYVQEQIQLDPASKNLTSNIAICYFSLGDLEKVIENLEAEQKDFIIKITAQRLKNCIGNQAKIVRLHRENFVAILPYIGNFNQLIKSIKIAQANLFKSFDIGKKKFNLTPYIGISFYPSQGRDLEILLDKAKQAVEYAQENFQDYYEVYQPELGHKLDFKSFILVNDLRKALQNNELEINYQPQINLYTREITGCEALIRWKHPQRGYIPPTIFIPIAENIGLINSIGTWFISTVCKQLKIWQQAGFSQLKLSINLSDYQLNKTNLISIITGALEQARLAPQFLAIEITENILFKNPQTSFEQLNRLKSLGVKVTIDNFGTGYSSLNYLQRFNFDILKVNMCYLNYCLGEQNSHIAIKYLIQKSRKMNLKLIVEKVETQEQLNFLCQNQCEQAQGFFLSVPLTTNEFQQLLQGKSDWLSNLFDLPPI